MNWIDLVLAILLLIGAIRGYKRGFIYELAIVGSLFLGLYAGFQFADAIAPKVAQAISASKETVHYISFFIVFLAVGVGIIFLAKVFESLIDIAFLGIFNKIAGAMFGLLKSAVLISLALYFFNKADTKKGWLPSDLKAESVLYYPIMKIGPAVLPSLKAIRATTENELS